eukprot:CAMPEP_0116072864 /NCGR_PEP_ID=MMETSP0322-20121206/14819_1 /TAXON_ID=163516 /ORGANISM="Leptocylindrus danicus var. apora, Strain B651" /LENGTH=377 /DNA_ID=CAMNT_0003561865 /DNA_START=135 /DNA_END=1269 /DNA_ORIENTATION=+
MTERSPSSSPLPSSPSDEASTSTVECPVTSGKSSRLPYLVRTPSNQNGRTSQCIDQNGNDDSLRSSSDESDSSLHDEEIELDDEISFSNTSDNDEEAYYMEDSSDDAVNGDEMLYEFADESDDEINVSTHYTQVTVHTNSTQTSLRSSKEDLSSSSSIVKLRSEDNRFDNGRDEGVNKCGGKYRQSSGGDIEKGTALVRSKRDLSSQSVLSTGIVIDENGVVFDMTGSVVETDYNMDPNVCFRPSTASSRKVITEVGPTNVSNKNNHKGEKSIQTSSTFIPDMASLTKESLTLLSTRDLDRLINGALYERERRMMEEHNASVGLPPNKSVNMRGVNEGKGRKVKEARPAVVGGANIQVLAVALQTKKRSLTLALTKR